RLDGVAYVDEREAAGGDGGDRALEKEAPAFGQRAGPGAQAEDQARVDADDLESGAAPRERGALGEELRAIVGPALDEPDGRLVIFAAEGLRALAHGPGAAGRREDDARHARRFARVEHALRAADVHAIELLGVGRLARHDPGAVEGAGAPCRRRADAGAVEHVAAGGAREAHDVVAVRLERRREVRTEKARGA